MKYPSRPCAADEQNALWLIAVDRRLKDTYSCEYNSDNQCWTVQIKASVFQNIAELVEQCRHALGWDIPANGKEAATQ